MARALTELSKAVASTRSDTYRARLKRRADVQRDAPRYDGGDHDFDAWWRNIMRYLREQEVTEAPERCIIIKNALEKRAAEYLNSRSR